MTSLWDHTLRHCDIATLILPVASTVSAEYAAEGGFVIMSPFNDPRAPVYTAV